MSETRMSIPEIFISILIIALVVLIPLFLVWLNSKIGVSIEGNDLIRATHEIAENLLNGGISENGGFRLDKLNEIDGTSTEPVWHCYAYYAVITTKEKLNGKQSWSFGFHGSDDKYSIDLPVHIASQKAMFPAAFNLKIYDTKKERCDNEKK